MDRNTRLRASLLLVAIAVLVMSATFLVHAA